MSPNSSAPPRRCRRPLTVAVVLVLLVAPLRALAAGPLDLPALAQVQEQVRAVSAKAVPATVAITHEAHGGVASGSGAVITPDGLVLTAAHVVSGAKDVTVTFPDGKRHPAKVLGGDEERDVALIRLSDAGPYPYVEMGHSGGLRVGDMVVALGHSGGFDPRRLPPVRFGRLFASDPKSHLQSDCTLISGDSGGPLFDLDGRVIGVHHAVGFDMSMNLDAPVDVVRDDWDRLLEGDWWGARAAAADPKFTADELAGLDLERFRRLLMTEAMGANGRIEATPETIAGWMRECGMKADRVKAMDPAARAAFVQRALGADAHVAPGLAAAPALPAEELAGLDLDRFRQRLMTDAMKSGGRLEATPAALAAALRECGMDADKVKAMSPQDLAGFIGKALGGAASVNGPTAGPATRPAGHPTTAPAGAALPGLDPQKLAGLVTAEAAKTNGRLDVTPDRIAQWLGECGADAAAVKKLSPAELAQVLSEALGGAAKVKADPRGPAALPAATARAIADQDRQIVDALRPRFDTFTPSVVTLFDGDKQLALGTVARADGFILTKQSEIAKAKGPLTVRLADGRSFSARPVHTFPNHDLALVHVPATDLHAIDWADAGPTPAPGTFLFAPGVDPAQPMAAMGVVSVPDRSLRESGGYLGIGLGKADGAVEATTVEPDGPADKAGLKAKDRILAVDGTAVDSPEDLARRVRALKPGAAVEIEYRHADEDKGEEHTARVTLGDRSKRPIPANRPNREVTIGTQVSDQRTGYPVIFQHDQPVRPEDCGNVVFDLDGRPAGVNIARAGRVDTYAIPAAVVAGLLKTVDFPALLTAP